jgi:hypothetical protein
MICNYGIPQRSMMYLFLFFITIQIIKLTTKQIFFTFLNKTYFYFISHQSHFIPIKKKKKKKNSTQGLPNRAVVL